MNKTTNEARILRKALQEKIRTDILRFTEETGCPVRTVHFSRFDKGLGDNGQVIVDDYLVRLDVDL